MSIGTTTWDSRLAIFAKREYLYTLWPSNSIRGHFTSVLGLPQQMTTNGWFKTEIYSLTVQEARSPKSRSWEGWFLLRAPREDHASLPASDVVCHFWRPLTCSYITPISASVFTWPSSCVSLRIHFCHLPRHSHWIWGPP